MLIVWRKKYVFGALNKKNWEKSNVFKNLYYCYFCLNMNFYILKVSFVLIKLYLISKSSWLTLGFAIRLIWNQIFLLQGGLLNWNPPNFSKYIIPLYFTTLRENLEPLTCDLLLGGRWQVMRVLSEYYSLCTVCYCAFRLL